MPTSKPRAVALTNVFDRVLVQHRSATKEQVKPYVDRSDEELIAAVQNGESDAFAFVVDRYQGKIFAYIMRLINHREEAQEITQDVFLKSYKYLHRFDCERKFSSWIYRIAHNESVNWLKKKTRAKIESLDAHMEIGQEADAKVDIHDDLARKQERQIIRQAIDSLPEKYREVMEMRYISEYSYQEISKYLKKPVNTVGTLINRAKKKLLTELEASP